MFNNKKKTDSEKRTRSTSLAPRNKDYSYHESRFSSDKKSRKPSEEKSILDRRDPSPSRPWYIQTLNTIIIIIVLVFIGYDSILNGPPKVIISGTASHTNLFSISSTRYQVAADKIFAQSITSRDKVSIDTAKLSAQFEKEFPDLAQVTVSLPLIGNQPTFTLIPAQPAIIVTALNQPGTFLVSFNGRVLATSLKGWPNNDLTKVVDQTGINYSVGRTTMSPSDISFINLVSVEFISKGLSITNMTLPAQTRELDVYISGEPYYVKFNLQDNTDAEQQIGTYLATRIYLLNNKITPSSYVDARVVGRVFYK